MISTTLKKKTSKSQSRWRKNAKRCCTHGALLPPEIFHSRPRQVWPRLCPWCFVALQAAGVVPVVFYIAYGVCSFLIVTFVMPLDTRFTVCDEGPTTRPPVELKGINHLDSLPGQGPINHVAGKYDAEISGLEQDVAALQQSLAIYP